MSKEVISIEIDGEELDLRPIFERLSALETRCFTLENYIRNNLNN